MALLCCGVGPAYIAQSEDTLTNTTCAKATAGLIVLKLQGETDTEIIPGEEEVVATDETQFSVLIGFNSAFNG